MNNTKAASLKRALDDVETLRGFLPICGHCKKIRDDPDYRNRSKSYIRDRAMAEFSHSICPDCEAKYYSTL